MAKGTSEYMKPKKKTLREIDEATGQSKSPPATKPPTQPKPKKQWWER